MFEDKTEKIYIKGNIIHNNDESEMIEGRINMLNKNLTLNLLYKVTAASNNFCFPF